VEVDPSVHEVGGHAVADDGTDLGEIGGSPLGVALDVGTTTVVLELVAVDPAAGTILAVAALENPQRFGGSDVLSRISYDEDHPGELRRALRRAVNHELRRLYLALGIERRRVVEAYVVGNPTMHDLLFERRRIDRPPPFRSLSEVAVRAGEASTTAIIGAPTSRPVRPPAGAGRPGRHRPARRRRRGGDLAALGAVRQGGSFGHRHRQHGGHRLRRPADLAASASGPAFEGGGVLWDAGADSAIETVRLLEAASTSARSAAPRPRICGSGLVVLAETGALRG
jgi:hypothetical protein